MLGQQLGSTWSGNPTVAQAQNVDRNPMEKEGVSEELVLAGVAAKRGKKLLAPVLFKGSTNALWFNRWLEEHLLPELNPNSTLILDKGLARMYAPFHRKNDVLEIANQGGHKVLFPPPYSPDFNRIEQDFAIIKKRRTYSAPGTSLDDIVKSYGNYLE